MKRNLPPVNYSSQPTSAQQNPNQFTITQQEENAIKPYFPSIRFREPQPNDNIYDKALVLVQHPVRFGSYDGFAYQLCRVIDVLFDPSVNVFQQSASANLNPTILPNTNPLMSYKFVLQQVTSWDVYENSTAGSSDFFEVFGNRIILFNPIPPKPENLLPQNWLIDPSRIQDECFSGEAAKYVVYALKPTSNHSSTSSGVYFPAAVAVMEDPLVLPIRHQQQAPPPRQIKSQKDILYYTRFANHLVHNSKTNRNILIKIKGEERFDKGTIVPTVVTITGQIPSLDDIRTCSEWYTKRRLFEIEISQEELRRKGDKAAERGVAKEFRNLITQQTVQLASHPNPTISQQRHPVSVSYGPKSSHYSNLTRQFAPNTSSYASQQPQSQHQLQQSQSSLQSQQQPQEQSILQRQLHQQHQLAYLNPNQAPDQLDREKYFNTLTTSDELLQFFLIFPPFPSLPPFPPFLYHSIAIEYSNASKFRFTTDLPAYIHSTSSLYQLLTGPLTKANSLDIAQNHSILQNKIANAVDLDDRAKASSVYSYVYKFTDRYKSMVSRSQQLPQVQLVDLGKKSSTNKKPAPNIPSNAPLVNQTNDPTNAINYPYLYAPTRQTVESMAMLATNSAPKQLIDHYLDLSLQPLSVVSINPDPSQPNQIVLQPPNTFFKDFYPCNAQHDTTIPSPKSEQAGQKPGLTYWGLFNLVSVLKPFTTRMQSLSPPILREIMMDNNFVAPWALHQHPSLYSRYFYNTVLINERQHVLHTELQYTLQLQHWWRVLFLHCQQERLSVEKTKEYICENALRRFPHDIFPIIVKHTPLYHSHAVYTLTNHPRVKETIDYYLQPYQSLTYFPSDHIYQPLLTPVSHFHKNQFDRVNASTNFPTAKPSQSISASPYIVPVPLYHSIVPLPNLQTLVNIQRRAPWAFLGTQFDLVDRVTTPQRQSMNGISSQQPQTQTVVNNYKEVYRFRNQYNPVDRLTKLTPQRIDKFLYSESDIDAIPDYIFDY